MLLAILGISLEIVGFVLVIKSTPKLVLKRGGFTSFVHVDPKTGEPLEEIEGPPNPLIYRPGIYMVIAGLSLQIADIVIPKLFNVEI